MELFADLHDEDAFAFAAFLKRLTIDDYRRHTLDEEEAQGAMTAGAEMILAFQELGFAPSGSPKEPGILPGV